MDPKTTSSENVLTFGLRKVSSLKMPSDLISVVSVVKSKVPVRWGLVMFWIFCYSVS